MLRSFCNASVINKSSLVFILFMFHRNRFIEPTVLFSEEEGFFQKLWDKRTKVFWQKFKLSVKSVFLHDLITDWISSKLPSSISEPRKKFRSTDF